MPCRRPLHTLLTLYSARCSACDAAAAIYRATASTTTLRSFQDTGARKPSCRARQSREMKDQREEEEEERDEDEKPEKEDGSKERHCVCACVLLSSPAFYKLPFRGGIFTNIQDGGVIFQALSLSRTRSFSGKSRRVICFGGKHRGHRVGGYLVVVAFAYRTSARVILKEALSHKRRRGRVFAYDHQGSAKHENYFGKQISGIRVQASFKAYTETLNYTLSMKFRIFQIFWLISLKVIIHNKNLENESQIFLKENFIADETQLYSLIKIQQVDKFFIKYKTAFVKRTFEGYLR